MNDAIRHHNWASLRLLDACSVLSTEQLSQPIAGGYGSVIDTWRHIVDADTWYIFRLANGGEDPQDLDASADLALIRMTAEANSGAWEQLLTQSLDPERPLVSSNNDGEIVHTFVGIRLAQAAHHGTDHRSQICTALTGFGIEPPDIDVWDYGESSGRLRVEPAPTSDGSATNA